MGFDVYPATTETSSAISTSTGATTGTRRGLRFQLPYAFKLGGFWWKGFPGGVSSDHTVELYDTGGGLLATLATREGAQVQAVSSASHLHQIWFDADYACVAATPYRLVIVPSSTNSVTIYETGTSSGDYFGALPGGAAFHLTKYVSSAWADVTTERPWMGLLINAVDDGAGLGGGTSEAAYPFVGGF